MTQFKQTTSRRKSTRAESITSEGSPVQQGATSPINNARGLSQANELVDHRLLTGKLGGWGHGPSNVGESTHNQGERRSVSQRVHLHAAPRTLPTYLIKLVNQLMRHGKKGLSVSLLADSLTLFLKRLEGSNIRNATILVGGKGKTASREGAKGVSSFPFYSVSFPGARFGDMLSLGKNQSNTLLGLPFSGTLFPHFSTIREKYRGSLGFEKVGAGKDQFLFETPPFPACWAGNRKELWSGVGALPSPSIPINPEMLSLTSTSKGLISHTQKPIYFWHMEGLSLSSKMEPVQSEGIPQKVLSPPSQASILESLSRAIANVEPSLEVRKKKIAGITRQIPCVVSKSRGEKIAIRWIINSARERVKKRGKGLPYCLAEELIDAYQKRGEPRQKRDSLHKAAESNRSFLRYRWW